MLSLLLTRLYGVILAQAPTNNCELVNKAKPQVDRLLGNFLSLTDFVPLVAFGLAAAFGLVAFMPSVRAKVGGALKYVIAALLLIGFMPILVDILYDPKCG